MIESGGRPFSPAERLIATFGAIGLLAGGATADAAIGTELKRPAAVHAEAPGAAPTPHATAATPEPKFDIYSLTIVTPDGRAAAGFSPVRKSPQQLGVNVLAGWNMLRSATHDALGPGEVTVEKPTTIEIPGITKASDLCDADKKSTFRNTLLAMAAVHESNQTAGLAKAGGVDNKPVVPVFVIEADGKIPKGCRLTADGLPGRGIVAYHSESYTDPIGIVHEMGHAVGALYHDNSLVNGEVKEYGNNGTIMGNNWDYDPKVDPDPLNAFELLALGGIKPEQIVTVPQDSMQNIELSTVASSDGSTVAIRVPVGPLGDSKTDPLLQCATAVYVELDTTAVEDNNKTILGYPHGISMYAVDERPVPKDSLLPSTVLMPFAPGDYIQTYTTDVDPIVVQLGNSTLDMYVRSLDADKAELTIHTTSDTPAAAPAVCG